MRTELAPPFPPRAPAIAAFTCFAPVVVSFAVAPGAWWPEYPGILFHLAIFFLVPGLNAPDWAKMAGYGWTFLDVTAGVLLLNHVPHEIADPLRLGAHIFAGIWIATASISGTRPMKVSGLPTALGLFGYTFVSPFLPSAVLAPASLLMLAWLAIVAWQNGSQRRPAGDAHREAQGAPTMGGPDEKR